MTTYRKERSLNGIRKKRSKTLNHAIALCIAMLCTNTALSMEYKAGLSIGTENTNNGLKDRTDQSELKTNIGLDVDIAGQTDFTDFEASYNAQYNDYKNRTNQDRTSFIGKSDLSLNLIKERISWLFSHSAAEITSSRQDLNTDDNRQLRQQYTTGPRALIPINKADRLSLSAQHSWVDFTESENPTLQARDANLDADSETTAISAGWLHAISSITDIILSYRYQELERDSSNKKLKLQNAQLGLTRTLRHFDYSISAGSSSSKLEGQASSDSFSYDIGLKKSFGSSTLALAASKEQSDTSIGQSRQNINGIFDDDNLIGVEITQENFISSSSVDITFFEIDFASSAFCSRCNYNIEYQLTKNDFNTSTANIVGSNNNAAIINEDDRQQNVNLNYSYKLRRNLTLDLGARYQHTELSVTDIIDELARSELFFNWHASRGLNIRFGGGYEQEKRGGGARDNYYEGFAAISVNYNFLSSPQR